MLALVKQVGAGAGIPRQLSPDASGEIVLNLADQSGSTGYTWHIHLPAGIREMKPYVVDEQQGASVGGGVLIGGRRLKQYRLKVSRTAKLPQKVIIWQSRSWEPDVHINRFEIAITRG